MIERKIIIGLITSTEYLRQLRPVWDLQLIESRAAQHLAKWVWEHFETYQKAPGRDIESIFYDKLKTGKLADAIAEELEQDILPSLSDEYEEESFNVDYLLQQTLKYFKERRLEIHHQTIETLLDKGEVEEAERLACDFSPVSIGAENDLDLSSPIALERVSKAFTMSAEVLIKYPGALGRLWNEQLVREGFVALMATEKRGKTFTLLDLAIRGYRQGRHVAFLQAGDMSENQQLKRICVYLARRSDRKKYCKEHWQTLPDCIHNQRNTCTKEDRECDFGVFERIPEKEIREMQLSDLVDIYEQDSDYCPCTTCDEYEFNKWGVPWIKKIDEMGPLTIEEGQKEIEKFFIKHKRKFKLSTYTDGTLSVNQIKAQLDLWEKQDGFVPDIIVVDYADLLTTDVRMEFRHQQNAIWKGLRNLSQEKHCLVLTATQADAASYESNRLRMKNFSEDKRKYAHVTAMYGLNQDKDGREKTLGLMRVNEIVVREEEFLSTNEVTVVQDLKRGRPFLGSYK